MFRCWKQAQNLKAPQWLLMTARVLKGMHARVGQLSMVWHRAAPQPPPALPMHACFVERARLSFRILSFPFRLLVNLVHMSCPAAY